MSDGVLSAPATRASDAPVYFAAVIRAAKRLSLLKIFLYVALVAIGAVPIAVLVVGSLMPASAGFGEALSGASLSVENYAALARSPAFLVALRNTLVSSTLGTLISIAAGSWLAFLVIRTDVPLKGFVTIAAVVPFFVSAFVHAFAWSALADPQVGILNLVFAALGWSLAVDINTVTGVALVQGLYHIPFVFLFVAAALHTVDPTLEEAARTSGAGVPRTVLRVTLPLVAPAMLSSGVLVFALMAGNFAIPSLLGTPANLEFVTSYLYQLMQMSPPRYGQAAAAGVVLMATTLALFFVQRLYIGKRSYLSVTGKGFRPRLIRLRGWKAPCVATLVLYVLVVVVIPLLALIVRSLRPYFYLGTVSDLWNPSLMSLRNFELLLEYAQVTRALINTAILSVASAVLGAAFFFLAGYGAERMDGRGLASFRYLVTLPSAVPGMVLGLSYLWIALYLPLPLYGTIWVLLLSYIARFMPQGAGSISSSLRGLHPELEESARVAGASTFRRLRYIMLPLGKQGIYSAIVLCFVLGVTELHTSILLYTSKTIVLSVVMYEFWQFGQWGAAAALSLLQSVLVVVIILSARRIFGVSIYPSAPREGASSAA